MPFRRLPAPTPCRACRRPPPVDGRLCGVETDPSVGRVSVCTSPDDSAPFCRSVPPAGPHWQDESLQWRSHRSPSGLRRNGWRRPVARRMALQRAHEILHLTVGFVCRKAGQHMAAEGGRNPLGRHLGERLARRRCHQGLHATAVGVLEANVHRQERAARLPQVRRQFDRGRRQTTLPGITKPPCQPHHARAPCGSVDQAQVRTRWLRAPAEGLKASQQPVQSPCQPLVRGRRLGELLSRRPQLLGREVAVQSQRALL